MPPKEKPRPPEKEIQDLIDWLAPRVETADAAARAAQGRVVLRRLNRAEYENTLCDLLGIAISRTHDQIGNGAAPGGGNYWAFDRQTRSVLHRWQAIESPN